MAATPDALALAREWQALFGTRYYLELQRLGRADDETLIAKTVALSQKTGIPVVATNDVRFLSPRATSSRTRRGSASPTARSWRIPTVRANTPQPQYLRSPEEMGQLFADIPEALQQFRRDRAPLLAAAQARRIAAA